MAQSWTLQEECRWFKDLSQLWEERHKDWRSYPHFKNVEAWIHSVNCPSWVKQRLSSLKISTRTLERREFARFSKVSCLGDGVESLVAALRECSTSKDLIKGRRLHARAQNQGLLSNSSVASSLIQMYVRCGSLVDARKLVESLEHPDSSSWSCLIQAHAERGEHKQVLELFDSMPSRDAAAFVAGIRGCTALAASDDDQTLEVWLKKGREIHALAEASPEWYTTAVKSSLVDMYSKCRRMDEAQKLFEGMLSREKDALPGYKNLEKALALQGIQSVGSAPDSQKLSTKTPGLDEVEVVSVLKSDGNVAASGAGGGGGGGGGGSPNMPPHNNGDRGDDPFNRPPASRGSGPAAPPYNPPPGPGYGFPAGNFPPPPGFTPGYGGGNLPPSGNMPQGPPQNSPPYNTPQGPAYNVAPGPGYGYNMPPGPNPAGGSYNGPPPGAGPAGYRPGYEVRPPGAGPPGYRPGYDVPGAGNFPPPQYNGPPGAGNLPRPQYRAGNLPPPQYNRPPGAGNWPPPQYNGPPGAGNLPPQQFNGPPGAGNLSTPQYNGPPGAGNFPRPQYNAPPGAGNLPPPQYNGPPGAGNLPRPQYKGPPGAGNWPRPQYNGPPTGPPGGGYSNPYGGANLPPYDGPPRGSAPWTGYRPPPGPPPVQGNMPGNPGAFQGNFGGDTRTGLGTMPAPPTGPGSWSPPRAPSSSPAAPGFSPPPPPQAAVASPPSPSLSPSPPAPGFSPPAPPQGAVASPSLPSPKAVAPPPGVVAPPSSPTPSSPKAAAPPGVVAPPSPTPSSPKAAAPPGVVASPSSPTLSSPKAVEKKAETPTPGKPVVFHTVPVDSWTPPKASSSAPAAAGAVAAAPGSAVEEKPKVKGDGEAPAVEHVPPRKLIIASELRKLAEDTFAEDDSLCSELQAIAYAMNHTEPGTTIRIVKETRVCEDCHEIVCKLSKMEKRKIICRDNNKLHVYENGECSCGNYW